MRLTGLLKDRISIYDHNENLIAENEIASVQGGNTIITANANYPVEIGYFIVRKTKAGVEEKYQVVEPNYFSGLKSLPEHYQMKVKNVKANLQSSILQTVNNISLQGNSRLYQDSIDKSNNSYIKSFNRL